MGFRREGCEGSVLIVRRETMDGIVGKETGLDEHGV
jgi:hypothetical protein